MKMHGKVAVCAIALGVLIGPAGAQDMRTASEKVVACQDVEDNSERLVCFEAAATELSVLLAAPTVSNLGSPATTVEQAAIQTGQAAPVQQASADTATERQAPKSSLPSWIPRVSFGSGRDVEKEPDEYGTKMTRIQRNKIGRHFFTTEDGHVWRQQSIEAIRAPKALPADVVLYQNVTGGVRIKILETNRSYGVSRVE